MSWYKSNMYLPKSLTGFLWYFVKRHKAFFIGIQLLAIGWSLDNTGWPYAFKLLIDKLLSFTGDKGNIWQYLMPVLLFWVVLWVMIEVMLRLQGFLMAKVFPRFEADIRMKMFEYVQEHSYDYFANNFAGNIANKISDMTRSATYVVRSIVVLFIPVLFTLIIAGGIFYSISHVFVVLLAIWSIIHITICCVGARKCANLANIHSTSRSFLNGKIVDTFTNIINVKISAKQKYEYRYINQYQKDECGKQNKSLVAIEKIKIALGVSSFIFPLILMTWYQIYSWQQNRITVGDLVLILNMNWNIVLLAWLAGLELPNLFKEIGICQQALSVIRTRHGIVDKKGAAPIRVDKGRIEFKEIKFSYPNRISVLDKVSLTIAAGTKVGLVGYSGSGKSTFVNLLMRFFDLDTGTILIDGFDISEVTKNSLRNQISMIPQEPILFHRSLRENISYGKYDASDDEVFEASKQAHCDEFIKNLPQGYDTIVGERGVMLSCGQRQRIAIARAILEDSPILIFDEATSALDSITESRVQDGMDFIMRGRTTIVIAHRLSTLTKMDRILVFENTNIIEDGTHESLLRKKGHYSKMWDLQAGGFLPNMLPVNLEELE